MGVGFRLCGGSVRLIQTIGASALSHNCNLLLKGKGEMHLIQIFLPLYDNEGEAFDRKVYDGVRDELMKKFDGVTAFRSSPAEGVWEEGGEVSRDRVIVFEVMAEELERVWWTNYRAELEARFRQEKMIVRAILIEQL
jgi:hypothetical protein